MTSAAAQPRPIRNAVRDARDRRRPPRRRQHHPEIDRRRCSRGARCVGDWLEHWARQTPEQDLSRRARQRRCAVDDRHLQRCVAAGALGGRLDSGARPERRASAGDPVRQQRRSRAVRARGPACRRALGRDLAGLFADVEGFRQAQEHDQRCSSPARSMSPAQSRSRRRLRRSSRCIRPRSSAAMPAMPTRFRFAPSRQRRKRRMLQRPSPR